MIKSSLTPSRQPRSWVDIFEKKLHEEVFIAKSKPSFFERMHGAEYGKGVSEKRINKKALIKNLELIKLQLQHNYNLMYPSKITTPFRSRIIEMQIVSKPCEKPDILRSGSGERDSFYRDIDTINKIITEIAKVRKIEGVHTYPFEKNAQMLRDVNNIIRQFRSSEVAYPSIKIVSSCSL